MHQFTDGFEQPRDWGATALLDPAPDGARSEWSTDPAFLEGVRLACQLARSARASLMLPDADGARLRLVAAIGLPHTVEAGASARLGDSVAGVVAQERRPVLVNDERDLAASVGPVPIRFRGVPFMSVPVPLGGSGYGVLNVSAPLGRAAFQPADLEGLHRLAVLIGATLPALSARERLGQLEDVIAQLQRQLIQVQERERQRLARDLHDEAGHALTIALLRVDLERVKPTTPPGTREALALTRDAIMGAANALNDMAFRLRPRILEDLGLLPALRTLVAQAQVPGVLHVTFECAGDAPPLPGDTELVAFRVVQECLTNTRKHAGAANAWVSLTFLPRTLLLVVQDDGIGIDEGEGQRSLGAGDAGQGLRGMRERVVTLGGTFAIGSRREGGTRVVATLPLRHPEQGTGQDG